MLIDQMPVMCARSINDISVYYLSIYATLDGYGTASGFVINQRTASRIDIDQLEQPRAQ